MKATRPRSRVLTRIVTIASIVVVSLMIAAQGVSTQRTHTSDAVLTTSDYTTYGGRAFGAYTQIPVDIGLPLLGQVVLSTASYGDTGYLSPDGGDLVADFTPVWDDVANGLVFLSYTSGYDGVAVSEEATSDVTLLAGTAFEIGASFTYVRAVADCSGAWAASEIPDLTIGGMWIPVTGDPNQEWSIPGVITVLINEQFGDAQSVTVNALHVWFQGIEVIVSSATSAVSCGGFGALGGSSSAAAGAMSARSAGGSVVPMWFPPRDFTTGGGFFEPPNSDWPGRVNFGFNAGPRPGRPDVVKGNLNLVDHLEGHHLKGDVTDYFRASDAGLDDPQDVCRMFAGPATFDGQSGFSFGALVCDYGEPGRYDRFAVNVFDGDGNVIFHADNARAFCPADMPNCGELDGGNIQLHRF